MKAEPCSKFVYTPDRLDRLMCWTCGFRKDAHSPEACVEPISTGIIGRRQAKAEKGLEPVAYMQAVLQQLQMSAMVEDWPTFDQTIQEAHDYLDAHPPTQAEKGLEPVAWLREWQGDASDDGMCVAVWTKEETDSEPGWNPVYAHPPIQVEPVQAFVEAQKRLPPEAEKIIGENMSKLLDGEAEKGLEPLPAGYMQRVDSFCRFLHELDRDALTDISDAKRSRYVDALRESIAFIRTLAAHPPIQVEPPAVDDVQAFVDELVHKGTSEAVRVAIAQAITAWQKAHPPTQVEKGLELVAHPVVWWDEMDAMTLIPDCDPKWKPLYAHPPASEWNDGAETHAKWLEAVAAEIAEAGHNGWSNTCLDAARFLRRALKREPQ